MRVVLAYVVGYWGLIGSVAVSLIVTGHAFWGAVFAGLGVFFAPDVKEEVTTKK